MINKKICYISGSRADFGLVSRLLNFIKNDNSLTLQLLVTGSHLSNKHGDTYKEILKQGFKINQKIKIIKSNDKSKDILISLSECIKKISKSIEKLKPDIILLLGDRYEIFASAISSFLHKIPICHIHGGEITAGAFDDAFRHSITKMSLYHFVTHKSYKKRIIQLGENPKNIFNVGSLGVDNIKKFNFLNKKNIEKKFDFKFLKKNIMIVIHPETLSNTNSEKITKELLKALSYFTDIFFIFSCPNADNDNKKINRLIKDYVRKNNNKSIFVNSMGHLNFLSCLKYVDCIVGNSSSGIIEAPSLKIPTINIGSRQRGRIKAKSVVECKFKNNDIIKSIKLIYSKKFKYLIKNASNPYENNNSARIIYNKLKKINIPKNLSKMFYDL